jgi:hypothetical protein
LTVNTADQHNAQIHDILPITTFIKEGITFFLNYVTPTFYPAKIDAFTPRQSKGREF